MKGVSGAAIAAVTCFFLVSIRAVTVIFCSLLDGEQTFDGCQIAIGVQISLRKMFSPEERSNQISSMAECQIAAAAGGK